MTASLPRPLLLCLLLSAPLSAGEVAKVLLLGDSLTEGQGVAEDATYAAGMERTLRAGGRSDVVLRNAGIGGSTPASGLSRLRWHLREKPPPSVLVLALGPNDGLRGLDLGKMKENLRSVIRLAKENRMKVLLAGMKIPPNYGKPYASRFEAVFAELARFRAANMGIVFQQFHLMPHMTALENAALGLAASAAGAGLSFAGAAVLSRLVFDSEWAFSPGLPLLIVLSTTLLCGVMGLLAGGRALAARPASLLSAD